MRNYILDVAQFQGNLGGFGRGKPAQTHPTLLTLRKPQYFNNQDLAEYGSHTDPASTPSPDLSGWANRILP